MVCRCGAEGCRRLITGQDWQKPALQEKYGSYFAWYLLEKIRSERSAAEGTMAVKARPRRNG
jgi:hypothetical protein